MVLVEGLLDHGEWASRIVLVAIVAEFEE